LSSWLGLLHGLDFLLTALLAGNVIFSFWIAPNRSKKLQPVLLFLLLILSCLWFVGLSAEMAESWKIDDLLNVAQNTAFGHLWIAKILFLGALISIARTSRLKVLLLSAVFLPLSFALTGHANAQPHFTLVFVGLDYAHFLGASIWTGGLVTLVIWLKERLKEVPTNAHENTYRVVRMFSRFAIASTTTIALSGLIQSYLYGVRPASLFGSEYSELVLLKTILFLTTLSLASVNHFVHLRKWNPKAEKKFVQSILRESLFELILIFAILLVAGFLTRSPLP
jgi:copper transport protein